MTVEKQNIGVFSVESADACSLVDIDDASANGIIGGPSADRLAHCGIVEIAVGKQIGRGGTFQGYDFRWCVRWRSAVEQYS